MKLSEFYRCAVVFWTVSIFNSPIKTLVNWLCNIMSSYGFTETSTANVSANSKVTHPKYGAKDCRTW